MSASRPNAILLVGGGHGIGLEITQNLLSTTSSTTQLIVFGLHIDEGLRNLSNNSDDGQSRRLHLVQGDVTKSEDRKKAVQTCLQVAAGGVIDSLMYCAGVMPPIAKVEDVDLDAVRWAYEINVLGVMGMVSTSSRFPTAVAQVTSPFLHVGS